MANLSPSTPVKSLDGTVRPLENNAAPLIPSSMDSLPSRPKLDLEISSKSALPPSGQTLTGKQEHCEWARSKTKHEASRLTVHRPQARTDLAASRVRDFRASFDHRVAEIRCPISIRIRRSRSCRFRSTFAALYFRSSCPKLSVLGPGKGEGILAR